MRWVLIFLFVYINAAELKIISKIFNYDPNKQISIFKEDVNATKEKDNILCDELIVYFDKNKKAKKIVAKGNVKFVISLDKNSTYKGKSKILIYNLEKGDIILNKGKIVKIETNESIKGDKIVLNRINKSAKVIGDKKPVEIIIKVNE